MARKKKQAKGFNPDSLKNLEKGNRFKKGESGNPAGRPPGSRNFKTVISMLMDQVIDLDKADLGKLDVIMRPMLQQRALELGGPITWREALILMQGVKALALQDTSAMAFLADREEGRPKQVVDVKARSYEDYLDSIPDPEDL